MKEIKIGILLSSATSSVKNVKDFLFNLDLNATPRWYWSQGKYLAAVRFSPENTETWLEIKKEGEREGAFERCLRRI